MLTAMPVLRTRARTRMVQQLLADATVSARTSRRQRTRFYQDLWRAAADDLGATVSPAPNEALDIALGSHRVRVNGTHCSIDGPDVLDFAGNKPVVGRLMAEAGLPVAPHRVFTLSTLDEAQRFLADAHRACVVKPAVNTAAGRGVTTGVQGCPQLVRAAAAAAAAGARVRRPGPPLQRLRELFRDLEEVPLLIEHQIAGANYRLLYLDGELIDAIRREPPTVIGDGRATIARLIAAHNEERLRSSGPHALNLVSVDVELTQNLSRQGLRPTDVPLPGRRVQLKTTVNENPPECNHPARGELCDALIDQAARAASIVGARLAGVDVITHRPGQALTGSTGCILEVNTTPGLAMHHHGHPGAVEPATVILRHLAAGRT
ncbi:hypothetical protein PA7_07510 [Pseudonocardia asaccharolytica DSM 44247 = NBRC 16224]|uniref:ATP-grasp domain-containing protein n=2 Tax=Pseudonocardia asaccharolytica TaxID=54010 RepID=A0A511D049_9PSEU|nr:hypothetical protein PA7_07510 [Pseudonocardia asaccharolytica DSM 44247 = NBRC 16224]